MADHLLSGEKKKVKTDQSKRLTTTDSKTEFKNSMAWDISSYLEETPFNPPIKRHVAILSGASSQERFVISRRLQQTYGNRYVQRLIQSVLAQREFAVREPENATTSDTGLISNQNGPTADSNNEITGTSLPNTNGLGLSQTEDSLDLVYSSTQKQATESLQQEQEPILTPDVKINKELVPILNDITPSTSSGLTTIKLGDVKIQGEVYQNGENWNIRIIDASTTIHWGITTAGYSIPNPIDGGNITEGNYKTVIRELEGYEIRQYAGIWHHPNATSAHEKNHVDWFKSQIEATWPEIKARIESHSLGATSSKTKTDAETDMTAYLKTEEKKWFDAYGLAPEEPAYAVGQAILNGIIAEIETYAKTKGWK